MKLTESWMFSITSFTSIALLFLSTFDMIWAMNCWLLSCLCVNCWKLFCTKNICIASTLLHVYLCSCVIYSVCVYQGEGCTNFYFPLRVEDIVPRITNNILLRIVLQCTENNIWYQRGQEDFFLSCLWGPFSSSVRHRQDLQNSIPSRPPSIQTRGLLSPILFI